MKSIVVPVNFSDCSGNAARYAAELAMILKADLHLIHVIQAPVTSADMVMTEHLYQQMVESANILLQGLQVELRKHTHGKIRVETILEAGGLSVKMKEICQRLQPYAVIIGSAGSTTEKSLTGSPLSSLLQNLHYPVLVVPENVRFRHFHHILLACDLEDIGSGLPQSLPLLKDLRDHFGSRFDVITVETPRVLACDPAVSESDVWKEHFRELYPDIHFIRTHKVEEGIREYLSQHEADLVLVFPKKHGLFEFHVSQSRKLAKHSPIPVMSIHEQTHMYE